jgi:signal transduction histidine kinase
MQAMQLFKILGTIYCLIIIFNIFISGLLWRNIRHRLFFDLFVMWICIFLTVIVQGCFLHDITSLHSTIAFTLSGTISFIAYSRVLINIVDRTVPWRIFFIIYLVSFIPYAILRLATSNYVIYFFPLYLASALPLLYSSLLVLLDWSRTYAFCERALAFVLLLLGLHALDFIFVWDLESFTPYGFAIGSILTIFVSILSLASMMQVVTQENTKIKTELALQSVLCNAARMSTLGSMAFGMAHEINNPLTIIQFNSEYIKDAMERCPHVNNKPKMETKFREIYQSVGRIKNILRLLSNFTREAEFCPKKIIDICELVDETIVLCQAQFAPTEILLETIKTIPANTTILGCGSGISQALMALLVNAYEALEAANVDRKMIEVELFRDGDDLVIAVSDNGFGIAPEIRRKLFEPFMTTKISSKHPGLSLSIAKRVIENQGGALYLDEKVSFTRFCIRLPFDGGALEGDGPARGEEA